MSKKKYKWSIESRKKKTFTRKEAVAAALSIIQNDLLTATTPLSYNLSLFAKHYADRVDEIGKGFLFFNAKTYVDAIVSSAKAPAEIPDPEKIFRDPNQLKFISLKNFKPLAEKQGGHLLDTYNDCVAKVNTCNFKIEYLINLVYDDSEKKIGYSIFLKPLYRLNENQMQFGDMEEIISDILKDLNFMLTQGAEKVEAAEKIAKHCGYRAIKDKKGNTLGFTV